VKWAYGVTTVPSRFNDLLLQTLKSLQMAGFDKPRLFVDGATNSNRLLLDYPELPVTFRDTPIRTVANWILSLWELYVREPHADRYVLFQDDLIAVRGLRHYLSRCKFPDKGYWNLYTFPQNQELAPSKNGWYRSNQRGLGALGLVFSFDGLATLLSHRHMIMKPRAVSKPDRAVDGAIVESMRQSGWVEYVHNPSLLQHVGHTTAMLTAAGTPCKTWDDSHLATSFPGEEFNAISLLSKPKLKPITSYRIGLVGFNCASGLGEKNRQLSTWLDIDGWLIRPHRKFHTLDPPQNIRTVVTKKEGVEDFIKSVDVLLFDETPFYDELIPLVKKHGKRLVCIPAMEWMPKDESGWPLDVDLFICPTRQCYDTFRDHLPCVYFPWPVDTDRFKFKQRTKVERFLFLNGRGGWRGRKGSHIICDAKHRWPDMPLLVRSQTPVKWPDGTIVLDTLQSNANIYDEGDVLLVPHAIDGTGLEPMEAMSCGMPVVSTDGQPWDEIPYLAQIPASVGRRMIKRMVDWYKPSAEGLVEVCKCLMNKDITQDSHNVRAWAENRSFSKLAPKLAELVRRGEP